MGMDVYGKHARSEAGAYFRNNVWWWRPLADYILANGPAVVHKCKYWHSNDGAGLNTRDSLTLAKWLREEIASGRCKEYADKHEAERKALPRETCEWCKGTGIRSDEVAVKNGMHERVIAKEGHPRNGQKGWCNACDGIGTRESFAAAYPFSVENCAEFATFLEQCGGFGIS